MRSVMALWAITHISRFGFIDFHTNLYVEQCFCAHELCSRSKKFGSLSRKIILGLGVQFANRTQTALTPQLAVVTKKHPRSRPTKNINEDVLFELQFYQ